MSKAMSKADVVAYLKGLPDEFFKKVAERLPPYGIRNLIIADLPEQVSYLDTYKRWVGNTPHTALRGALFETLDPTAGPLPEIELKPGIYVLLKTREQMLATPGVYQCGSTGFSSSPTGAGCIWNSSMASTLHGKVVQIKESLGSGIHASSVGYSITPWMVERVIKDTDKQYISDPLDPRLASILGTDNRVHFSNCADGLVGCSYYLVEVRLGNTKPFGIATEPRQRFATYFAYIQPTEEPKTLELTMADLEAKYGCKVKIKASETPEE